MMQQFWKKGGVAVALSIMALLTGFGGTAAPGFARSAHTAFPQKSSNTVAMRVTFFGWDDNDPPSADIAYPAPRWPTQHDQAYEGTGTYADPVTFATDRREFAPGTHLYVPFLQKYIIMEDYCGRCRLDWKQGIRHIDVWMGPQYASAKSDLTSCENRLTQNDPSAPVITNPPPDLPVDKTPMFQDNTCTGHIH